MISFSLLTLALATTTAYAGSSSDGLTFDSNGRLTRNSILYQDTPQCKKKISDGWGRNNQYSDVRNFVPMSSSMYDSFIESGTVSGGDTNCLAVCVDTGLAEELIPYPLPFYVYSESSPLRDAMKDKSGELQKWAEKCKSAEVGFISYYPHEAVLYWLDGNKQRRQVGILRNGERHTVWQSSFLGHTFEVCDKETDELLLRHTMMHHSHVVVGHEYHLKDYNDTVQATFDFDGVSRNVEQAMASEWDKCNRVSRTFTPLGFSKGKLPKDIWGSISGYHYNNKDNVFAEEWTKGNKGYFVNWWEVTPYMIGMPWNLKRYWQSRLKDMVAKWIGGNITLENTDIYGIRRYEDGARLLTHVDRESTHAVSMIVNVDQVMMREPWMVEIYDFAGRLHEVEMSPGDVVYYESAKALHGRMKPLRGASYSNLFTHYRPIGDPQWSTRPNPKDTPHKVMDIDHCQKIDGVVDCNGVKLPFLSPSNEVVRGPNDLFSYWKRIGGSMDASTGIGEL